MVNPTSYCCVNTAVPILRFYLDQAADHRAHLRLSLPSIRSLIAAVSLESEHGWDKDIKVLVFLHWLAHAASYKAITDHHGKFLDVFVGYPGSVHDSRVLRNSPVYAGSLYPPPGKCILRDGGYLCLSAPICLITPYREPVQNPVQARFNSKHSRARSIVERAFGMMKARWRSLYFKALEVSPVFVPEVVACCSVLHKLNLFNGDIVEPVEEDHDDGPPSTPQP
ncbi:Protein ALP1-like [Labeo rohita]|uniref:Protein ALP1-like n=1 Tax=Labeo rohita TaxID=84645 RepID=A0ABQ8ME26_LABRO|nr:Protein ALP1-like [Labeo rohita]